ncbi:MAG: HAD family phosphatase [Treponema sp.]|uniref:HAD family hydrolase n=1 Tax=Treponema sp. TaxID=166 RepID=UPI0025EFD2CB|nr:HAD family phosphatase [Treponema sp.]MBQ9281319.1 HAD family phosphatase [Treponema sp.]
MENIKAVLFDMDGVLLDTESVTKICWYRAAGECGLAGIESIFMECVGLNRPDTVRRLSKYFPGEKDALAFRERTSELFDVVEREEGLKKMPFVTECLDSLKKAGFRLALASSTRAVKVHPQLKNAGIFDYFETLTTGDMVEHSKPDPEIYLKSASSLSLSPAECVAIEDSPNGVRSAFAAGIRCIMVPDLIQPDAEMKEKAWRICGNLKVVAEVLSSAKK